MRRVNRRTLTFALPLVATAIASGCTTFSDNDAVARVDDVEFSQAELDERAGQLGFTDDDPLTGDAARAIIGGWIGEQAIGVELLATAYGGGLDEAGVVCPNVMATGSPGEAEDAATRLRGGEEFADVFDDLNTDASLVETQGAINCVSATDLLDVDRSSPDVVALAALSADDPVQVAVLQQIDGSEFGVVLALRPFDELNPIDLSVLSAAVSDAPIDAELDVYVDPRFGWFDPDTQSVLAFG